MRNAVVVPFPTPSGAEHRPFRAPGTESELLHEVRTGVAGIEAAARLLRTPASLTGEQERRLEQLMEAELARLQRLLAGASASPRPVDLDELVGIAVLSHRARGLDVRWQGTACRAVARPDDVVQVLHVLLANAARHAPESAVTVSVNHLPGLVEVRVSDDGPGVAVSVQESLFTRGARGAGSPGQGLGLFVARRLVKELGGDLRLERQPTGATFVVTLPSAESWAS